MNIFQKVKKFFGFGYEKPPAQKLAEIPQADYAPQRKATRRRWQSWRDMMQRIGPPVLTGLRLQRTIWACKQGSPAMKYRNKGNAA